MTTDNSKARYEIVSLQTGETIDIMQENDMDLYCNRHNLLDSLAEMVDLYNDLKALGRCLNTSHEISTLANAVELINHAFKK